jgi:hypothetical protein
MDTPEEPRSASTAGHQRFAQAGDADGTPLAVVPASRSIVVEVVNDLGRLVPQATVYLRRFGEYERIGITDSSGRVRVDWSGPELGIVNATHPDYAPASAPFALASGPGTASSDPAQKEAAQSVVQVVLSPAGLIHGAVVVAGQPGPSGVTVFACPSESSVRTYFQAPDQFRSDPEHVSTQTDEAGRFQLRVDPRRRYSLIAGGSGLVQSHALHRVRADGPAVEIELVFGYALAVRVLDTRGEEIRSEIFGTSQSSFGASEQDPDASLGNFTDPAALCAGLPPGFRRRNESDARRSLTFYSSPIRKPRVGPITFSVNVPGYEEFETVDAWATPLDEVSYVDVRLRSIVDERGGIRIRIRGDQRPGHGADTVLGFHAQQAGIHVLNLRNEILGTLKLELKEWSSGVCECPDVPAGTYQAWFSTYPNPWFIDPAENDAGATRLTVTANQWSEIEYELPPSGSLLVHVVRPDGEPFHGFLGLTISRSPVPHTLEDGSVTQAYIGGAPVFFQCAPYRLGGLVPNNYAVYLGSLERSEEHRPTVTISAGSTSEVTLELPD